jgi:hypothetical protein
VAWRGLAQEARRPLPLAPSPSLGRARGEKGQPRPATSCKEATFRWCGVFAAVDKQSHDQRHDCAHWLASRRYRFAKSALVVAMLVWAWLWWRRDCCSCSCRQQPLENAFAQQTALRSTSAPVALIPFAKIGPFPRMLKSTQKQIRSACVMHVAGRPDRITPPGRVPRHGNWT